LAIFRQLELAQKIVRKRSIVVVFTVGERRTKHSIYTDRWVAVKPGFTHATENLECPAIGIDYAAHGRHKNGNKDSDRRRYLDVRFLIRKMTNHSGANIKRK
jgi:hypothetical protein